MKRYLTLLTLSVVAIAIGFTSCKKDGPVEPADVAVTGVSFYNIMLILEINESISVKATVAPEDATNKDIEWSIKDPAIATVENGVVKGVAVGETELTATTVDGGFKATLPVKVVTERIPVTGIEFQNTLSHDLKEGKTAFFTAMISPANATDMGTIWESDNPEVASIDEIITADNYIMAKITGVTPGKATISVTTNDGGFKRFCPITVIPIVKVTEINLWPTTGNIEIGETLQIEATVLPSDAENKKINWSSSDTSVATVDANGMVKGISEGETTITATAKDGSGVENSISITVLGKKPTSITFDGEAHYEFDSWQGKVIDFKNDLKMKILPEGADMSRIEWSITITSSREDAKDSDVKYDVTEDNVILSYAYSTNWVAEEKIYVAALVDGISIGNVTMICCNRAALFAGGEDLCDFSAIGNKFNWSTSLNSALTFVKTYKTINNVDIDFDKYYIPASEYTLTSSDENKIKVTKNDNDKSWKIERLNTTDLVAVTLTYKCGEHTQTYTINLIP